MRIAFAAFRGSERLLQQTSPLVVIRAFAALHRPAHCGRYADTSVRREIRKLVFYARGQGSALVMEAHEIVHHVQQKHPKLAYRLSRITGKSDELFRSHGREPKSRNPLSSGNCSPVTHFVEYCHQYEAGETGAGRMLSNHVHAVLESEFTECELSQSELHVNVIDEGADVQRWLASFDLDSATAAELKRFEEECSEAIESISKTMSAARARRRVKEAGIKAATNGRHR